MNLIGLIKSARSSQMFDFASLFKSLGVRADLEELPADRRAEAFQRIARATLGTGASVVRVLSTMPDGSKMEAIMVMTPALVTDQVTRDSKKTLDTIPQSL